MSDQENSAGTKQQGRWQQPITDLSELKRGMIVQHKSGGEEWLVDHNLGKRVTAVATKDITNPSEWVINHF